ncbi:helix-turn-helix domain-containing protein [Paenibacillus tarimensis]
MDSILSVQNAINYIEEHLFETMELHQIAEKAFMSVPNLYRAFYALTGHPIKEYIRKRRISVSASHLRYSEKLVTDIAIECGFDSYQAFIKMFKKLVGMTPGAYRKADIHYTFEAVNLLENISYVEEKALSEQYPDVKVIRFLPFRASVYRYRSSKREGIEEEAFHEVMSRLERLGWNLQRVRLFGKNVDFHSREKPFGYDIMIPFSGKDMKFDTADFYTYLFPGGLYAVGKSLDMCGEKIVASWDRLLSEWLPRSTFELGDHPYVEEYLTYQGAITRIKLYLPVKRKHEPDTLEISFIEPFTVFAYRGQGVDAQTDADKQMIAWISENGMPGRADLRLLMSYSYGVESGEDYWFEFAVSIPDQRAAAIPRSLGCPVHEKRLGGGLYVCLITGAYGMMTGVLDRMHRWLYTNGKYSIDDSRQWFAEYIAGDGDDIERSTSVKCHIPVVKLIKK